MPYLIAAFLPRRACIIDPALRACNPRDATVERWCTTPTAPAREADFDGVRRACDEQICATRMNDAKQTR
jgi:hypothetical protein